MNKPAVKEPSMDEILSSIRQIIADDDAGAVRKAAGFAAATPGALPSAEDYETDPEPEPEPLALSLDQVVRDDPPVLPPIPAMRPASPPAAAPVPQSVEEDDFGSIEEANLVEADDITFEAEPIPPAPAPAPFVPPLPPAAAVPRVTPRIPSPLSEAAPLPDPTLSRDIAEQLLEPATKAAVHSTFAKLNNVAIGVPTLTIEQMIREMLRPMLKEWLDENLPAVVERMVEKEIARIARGV